MKNNTKNIYLFGTSTGAVAIMKAVADDNLKPKGIIIECLLVNVSDSLHHI